MNQSLVERYRAALQAGHVALARGRLEEAAAAYREAIELGPDRAVPRRSLGAVCLRLGEPVAALTAFDAALELEPEDDEATHGRAQALVVLRRPAEAASAYDRLADLRAASGRPGDACDALRRALEIEVTEDRRDRYRGLVEQVRSASGEAEAEQALERARGLLEDEPAGTGEVEPGAIEPAVTGGGWPAEAEADAAAPPAPPDGEALAAEADAAAERADVAGAREAAMAAAHAYRSTGHVVAAIDVLLRVQRLAPDDRELHLMLAELQADRGWTAIAAEKLRHLARLAELEGDHEAAARILGTGESAGTAPGTAPGRG